MQGPASISSGSLHICQRLSLLNVECSKEVTLELRSGDTGTEATSGVDRSTSVVDASDLDDEEREADADGGDEGVFGLLGGEHEDCEDEVGGQELIGFTRLAFSLLKAVSHGFVHDHIPSQGTGPAQHSYSAPAWSAQRRCRLG